MDALALSSQDESSTIAGRSHGGRSQPGLLGIAALLAALLAWASVGASATPVKPFTVPLPTVTGPIKSTFTGKDYPFNSRLSQIAPFFYNEQEFFIAGNANIYDYDAGDNDFNLRQAVDLLKTKPYKTRFVIRYPANPENFSGNVVVELYNPSGNFDVDVVWPRSRDSFLRNGDAWVGITIKDVSIAALKIFNAKRYATMNLADNGQIWDIVAQVGRFLKNNGSASPLHGYHVRRVYATGDSQSAEDLVTYINAFHSLERMPGKDPVYDGYLPVSRYNLDPGINSAAQAAANTNPEIFPCSPRLVFVGQDVPIINVQTQTDIGAPLSVTTLVSFQSVCERRADSDAPHDRFRLWEVPGSAHADFDLSVDPPAAVDLTGTAFPIMALNCDHVVTRFPLKYVENAAFVALYNWVDHGVAPPKADRIKVVDPTAVLPIPVLDSFGNAEGGIRTPYLDVPIGSYFASDTTPAKGFNFCFLFGYEVPFSDAKLDSRYATHAAYVNAVTFHAQAAVAAGFLLKPDALEVESQAEGAQVP